MQLNRTNCSARILHTFFIIIARYLNFMHFTALAFRPPPKKNHQNPQNERCGIEFRLLNLDLNLYAKNAKKRYKNNFFRVFFQRRHGCLPQLLHNF